MTDITNTDDLIDVRDIIARVDELEAEREALQGEIDSAEAQWLETKAGTDEARTAVELRLSAAYLALQSEAAELSTLSALLADLAGYGGDEQWRGDWYPVTLIRDSYFKDYAQELAEDVCSYDISNVAWPLTCIDWEKAARELQMDYSTVEFDGVTYWYR